MKMKILLVAFMLCALKAQGREDSEEALVIFTQPEDLHFELTTVPQIRQFAEKEGIQLILKEAGEGLPANITTTPALIFQNFRGRSIYSNRYAEFTTISNFVRTSRVASQRPITYLRSEVLARRQGRTTIALPIKITPISGKGAGKIDAEEFKAEIIKELSNAMQSFDWEKEVRLKKTDRLFYIDLHPYLDERKNLYLSSEIYSQFSCQDPIFSQLKTPVNGTWERRKEALKQVAVLLEQEINRQIIESKIGDAFTPVSEETAALEWEDLGLQLPSAPSRPRSISASDLPRIPNGWSFYKATDEAIPIVQFRFMEPLDRYAGEVRTLSGNMELDADQQRLTGNFEAEMQSLTMGMASFDENVLGKYIKAFKFPRSSFQFDSSVPIPPLNYGQTQEVIVDGTFELMRRKRPVKVQALLTPIVSETGQPLLLVNAFFSLNIVDDFKIKGPDGPAPARKTLLFDLNFLMKAEH